MDNIGVEFVEIGYDECADKLLNYADQVSLFYMDGKYIHQIKSGTDFMKIVASNLRVYQQFTRE